MTIDEIQVGKWYTVISYGQDAGRLEYIKGRCVKVNTKKKEISLKFFNGQGYPWRTTQVIHITSVLAESGRPGFMSNY